MQRRSSFGSVVSLGALLAACGGSATTRPSPASPKAETSSAPASTAQAPRRIERLPRREVMSSLSAGLGAFLSRLDVEAVHDPERRFHGWRILALHGSPDAWAGVDLAPLDVVTSVNGMPIERPEQAMACWQSLAVTPELRVSYERAGRARELRIPIDDASSPGR